MIKNVFFGFTALALIGSLFALPARAQDPEPQTASDAQPVLTEADQADQLLATIGQAHGDLVRLIGEVPSTEGEDLLLLRTQIDELAEAQHADLLALVGLMEEQGGLGGRSTLLE